MNTLEIISPEQLNTDVFSMIGKQWMLITAKKDGVINTMTAAWGGLGYLWNKKVAFLFIRPQRYTKEFVDAADEVSLTFFDESYRKELTHLGRVSGRDEDKIKTVNFHPADYQGVPYFLEADTIIIGKKLYRQRLEEACFLDTNIIDASYPLKDFHDVYVVEIETVLKNNH